MNKQTVALIGVGIMGRGIAKNLKKANCKLNLYTRSPSKIKELADDNTKICNSIEEAVKGSAIVILCLTEDWVIREAFFKANITQYKPKYIIDFGTTSPDLTLEMYRECNNKGIAFMDSPMTGSKNAAESGQIIFMVGCDDIQHIENCNFVYNACGKKVILCGNVGTGQKAKIALNMVQAGILQVYMEGMMISEKSGIKKEVFFDVISNSGAKSGIADFKLNAILQRDFSTHFALKNMNKDLNHAIKLALDNHVSLPLSFSLKQIYDMGLTRGLEDEDFCSLIKINEMLNRDLIQ
ncbi:MAG: NAD(P)-dependent oxidoreductase [Leptospiraceae bacterium]|nr:NAD(P)-dependent oxidoreductase [Leptospiraceae bacterium]MCP5497332.1 NAD(P)-dependent oxidoreductase [Leptospiraceae bacterium]